MQPGDVISYTELVLEEEANLQRGMNYKLHGGQSVILMSTRPGAPYNDTTTEDGKSVIYEGHDAPKSATIPNPKEVDQPYEINGKLTQNGLFYDSANSKKNDLVKVYEKIRNGIWVYNGLFILVDAWRENDGTRNVFKFRLEIANNINPSKNESDALEQIPNTRMIPSFVKKEVWKRDRGKCRICSSAENLHFDHIIPYSKGGSSLVAENIQLLCAKHNLQKHDRIE